MEVLFLKSVPLLFFDNYFEPTILAIARAAKHAGDVTR